MSAESSTSGHGVGALTHIWADIPALAAAAGLGLFVWLLFARPDPPGARLLLEVAAVVAFVVGSAALASVFAGAALLEEHSDAEPLRFQEAGWILSLPVGLVVTVVLVVSRNPALPGNAFTIYIRPLLVAVGFAAVLWAVLTRLLLRREGLTRDDYACAPFMPRAQYMPLVRRKQAWLAARRVAELTPLQAQTQLPDIVPALADRLQRARTDDEAKHILQLLGGLGQTSVAPVLLESLASPRPPVRRAAAVAIGRLELLEAQPQLVQAALEDKHAMVRRAAVVALGKLKDRMALPTLLQAVEDKDTGTAQSACVALGKLRDPEALPALEQALKDRRTQVRGSAAKAIEQMTGDRPEVEDEGAEK